MPWRVLPYVFGYGANGLLPAADGGAAFLAYGSVVTDFGRHLGQVRGNDILGGGDGDDTLVGDDQVIVARNLEFDAATMARAEALARELLDVSDDFSDLVHRQFDLLDAHDDDDDHDDATVVVDQVFTIGADELDGGDGNDVLVGDDNLLIEPSTCAGGLAGDFDASSRGCGCGDELAHGALDLSELLLSRKSWCFPTE
jgi:Ca2+-binding RTX toxin-like protein